MYELQAGVKFSLAVLPQPPAFLQPPERSFHDPSLGQNNKRVQFIALDDLHRRIKPLSDAVGKRLSSVAPIDQHAFNPFQVRSAAIHCGQRAVAIGHIGRGDRDSMRQALRIDGDVALDAGNFFARAVALLLRAVGVLHALRINDQEAGHAVASLLDTGRANLIFLMPVPTR